VGTGFAKSVVAFADALWASDSKIMRMLCRHLKHILRMLCRHLKHKKDTPNKGLGHDKEFKAK